MLIELKNRILIAPGKWLLGYIVAGEIDTGENIFGGVSKCPVSMGLKHPCPVAAEEEMQPRLNASCYKL